MFDLSQRMHDAEHQSEHTSHALHSHGDDREHLPRPPVGGAGSTGSADVLSRDVGPGACSTCHVLIVLTGVLGAIPPARLVVLGEQGEHEPGAGSRGSGRRVPAE